MNIKSLARLVVASGVTIGALSVMSGVAHADHQPNGYSPCRGQRDPAEARFGYEDQAEGSPEAAVTQELPTIYTDGEYWGACGGNAADGTDSFIEVNPNMKAVNGKRPVAEGKTGNADVDNALWPHGPAGIWIGPGQPTGYGCAPEGTTTGGYSNGNSITNELPTIYTDGTMVGVCGSAGFVEVNGDVFKVVNGKEPLVTGESSDPAVQDQLWAYGPATYYPVGGGVPGNGPSCAPSGSTKTGHANGNNITRELPTIYNKNATVGACGGGGNKAEAKANGTVTVTKDGAKVI